MKRHSLLLLFFLFLTAPIFGQLNVDGSGNINGSLRVGQSLLVGADTTGEGSRIYWVPTKGAFRVGTLQEIETTSQLESRFWDLDSIGDYSFISGQNNLATSEASFIGSGIQNTVRGNYSAIVGGVANSIEQGGSFIGGGVANRASGVSTFIGGGEDNTASGSKSATIGGTLNSSSGYLSIVLGGLANEATANYSATIGGWDNNANEESAVVAGGTDNTAIGTHSFIGGGRNNTTSEQGASIVGGNSNTSSGLSSFIGGGSANLAEGFSSFIGGGIVNFASGSRTFIGGGEGLRARSFGETVIGLFNEDYSPQSPSSFNSDDRLFTIGNGTGENARGNALTVLKNGNTGIGISTPQAPLQVEASESESFFENGIYLFNPRNVDNQHAILSARVAGNAAGDPFLSLDVVGEQGWSVGVDNSDDNKFKFSNSGTSVSSATKMTIHPNGNVGIGATNPQRKLHLRTTNIPQLRLQDVGGFVEIYGGADFLVRNSSGVNRLEVKSSGIILASNLRNIGDRRRMQYNDVTGEIGYDNSSRRDKRNIRDLEEDFNAILEMTPKIYTRPWSPDYQEIGFIAEDFHDGGLFPLVEYDTLNRPDGLRYDKMVTYLIPIIKEQRKD